MALSRRPSCLKRSRAPWAAWSRAAAACWVCARARHARRKNGRERQPAGARAAQHRATAPRAPPYRCRAAGTRDGNVAGGSGANAERTRRVRVGVCRHSTLDPRARVRWPVAVLVCCTQRKGEGTKGYHPERFRIAPPGDSGPGGLAAGLSSPLARSHNERPLSAANSATLLAMRAAHRA